jgi:hypothetical protein
LTLASWFSIFIFGVTKTRYKLSKTSKTNTMKKLHLPAILIIAFTLVALLPSCRFKCVQGSGHQSTQTLKMGDFSRINIEGGFKVVLKQDSSKNVSITADDNLQQYIHTESDGDELHIYRRKNVCESGQAVINIGVRNLNAIKGSGAISFSSDGKLHTQDLQIKLSGAGKVDFDLTAANVTTRGSGSTDITLRGQATSHHVELTGEGTVSALDFVVGSYDIHTTGASQCQINVLNSLNVNTTGSSDIKYRGNPTDVNSSKTGSSTLTKIN